MKVRRPTISDVQNPFGWMLECASQVNLLSEGKQSAHYASGTAAPTTGTWAQGDFVKNSNITEQGIAMSKYIIFGWACVSGGTPGTWVQCRFLTGN